LISVDAVIFDLDGVLVDSWSAVRRHWALWAEGHGLDAEEVLFAIQGRTAREAVRELAPHLDAAAEVLRLQELELSDGVDIRVMPGAERLLGEIPAERWAIVTSGTAQIARARLRDAGLPLPRVLVTADDVREGKPSPEGMLLAAKRLRATPARCVVVEDADAGIAAAISAGMHVIHLAAHGPARHAADLQIASLAEMTVRVDGGALQVLLHPPA